MYTKCTIVDRETHSVSYVNNVIQTYTNAGKRSTGLTQELEIGEHVSTQTLVNDR